MEIIGYGILLAIGFYVAPAIIAAVVVMVLGLVYFISKPFR